MRWAMTVTIMIFLGATVAYKFDDIASDYLGLKNELSVRIFVSRIMIFN
jgi:hypothetical protein